MSLRYIYRHIYTPSVDYKKLYHEKFSDKKMDPYQKMDQNCKYALKIAEKLKDDNKFEEAIYYYEEALKLGGNKYHINGCLYHCKRILNSYQRSDLVL